MKLRGKRSEMVDIKLEDGWYRLTFPSEENLSKEDVKLNWIDEVVDLLGMNMGERFRLENSSPEYVFYFDDDGLHCEKPYPSPMGEVFQELVCGKRKIKKFRRRPEYDEAYWFINTDELYRPYISCGAWRDNAFDYALYTCGNCFGSEYEAQCAIPWYIENVESVVRGLEWRTRE